MNFRNYRKTAEYIAQCLAVAGFSMSVFLAILAQYL